MAYLWLRLGFLGSHELRVRSIEFFSGGSGSKYPCSCIRSKILQHREAFQAWQEIKNAEFENIKRQLRRKEEDLGAGHGVRSQGTKTAFSLRTSRSFNLFRHGCTPFRSMLLGCAFLRRNDKADGGDKFEASSRVEHLESALRAAEARLNLADFRSGRGLPT